MVRVDITQEEIQAIDILSRNANYRDSSIGWIIENFKAKVARAFGKEQEDAVLERARVIIAKELKEEKIVEEKKKK